MNKRLFVLLVSIFVVNIGFGMTLPVLAFYTERLVLSDGVPANLLSLHVGLITSVYAAMQLIFAPIWGRCSDRFGRKPLLLMGIGGFAIAQFAFGLASNLWLLYFARILGGVFSAATLPAAAAFISDTTTEAERNHGMAWLGTAASLGVVLGPALGGGLANRDWHFRISVWHFVADSFSLPFLASFSIAAAALVIAVVWLPESHRMSGEVGSGKFPGLGWFELFQTLRPLLFLSLMSQAGLALFEAIFVLFAKHDLEFGPIEISIAFVICGLVMAVSQGVLVGFLSNWIRETFQIVIGFFLTGLSLFLVVLMPVATGVFIFVGVLALGIALIAPNISALVSKSADSGNSGSALGIQGMANSLGQTAGPLIGGLVFIFSVRSPFFLAGALLLATALIVLITDHPSLRVKSHGV